MARAPTPRAERWSSTSPISLSKGDNQPISLPTPAIKRRRFTLAALSPEAELTYSKHPHLSHQHRGQNRKDLLLAKPNAPACPLTSTWWAYAGGRTNCGRGESSGDGGAQQLLYLLPKYSHAEAVIRFKGRLFCESVHRFYGDDEQRVEELSSFITGGWSPKMRISKKWKRGELVEPKKPIVYYTPRSCHAQEMAAVSHRGVHQRLAGGV